MDECRPILNTGLRGFSVATTRISHVDKAAEKLIYRGFLAKDLANSSTFEEVVFLLLYERLPDSSELEAFNKQLTAERSIPPELIAALKTRPKDSLPMDILQASVPMLANHDQNINTYTAEASALMGIKLVAAFPTIVAAWNRIRNNKEPIEPLDQLGPGDEVWP